MQNLIILYNPYYEKDVIEQQFDEINQMLHMILQV